MNFPLLVFQLEAGDIILAINEREVVRLSTKEVLKCLRLSGEIVNIKYKRGKFSVLLHLRFVTFKTGAGLDCSL